MREIMSGFPGSDAKALSRRWNPSQRRPIHIYSILDLGELVKPNNPAALRW
jgi:hypothetical protein